MTRNPASPGFFVRLFFAMRVVFAITGKVVLTSSIRRSIRASLVAGCDQPRPSYRPL